MNTWGVCRRSVRAVLVALLLLPHGAPSAHQPAIQTEATSRGQTATALADGRWLLVGGEGTESRAMLWDPATGTLRASVARPAEPRAWHTATVLADGTILIVGGRTPDGRILSAPERFDPSSETFEALSPRGLSARVFHTATLLTTGSVVLAGGETDGNLLLGTADLWEPGAGAGRPLEPMITPRRGHVAELDAEGHVRIRNGIGPGGERLEDGEIYDPVENRFSTGAPESVRPSIAYLAASIPPDGATDVSSDTLLALRFSTRLRLGSIDERTVQLVGPDGPVEATRVLAEAGRLLFLRPVTPLAASTTYRIELAGLLDTGGAAIGGVTAFTTRAGEVEQDATPAETEWSPDPSGRDRWETGRPDSPWRSLKALEASPGTTALAGQVLATDGAPLPHVTVKLGEHETVTDAAGRFLLTTAAAGRGILVVHAHAAGAKARNHGMYEIQVDVIAGRTTLLPFTIWLPVIDDQHRTRLDGPGNRRAMSPRMPGVEVEIPEGVTLRSEGGARLDFLTLTPVPADRAPMPLPAGIRPLALLTLQTHGARVEASERSPDAGVRIVYPNTLGLVPGTRVDLWTYDAAGPGWTVYGQGSVTRDGRRVEPDRGVRLRRVQCMQLASLSQAPAFGPSPGGGPSVGEPVDLATGLFVMDKTDVALPDVLPIVLTRVYRQSDSMSRAFGIGMSHSYDLFLAGPVDDTSADLILPDGGRVHYVRTSPGTGHTTAVMEHTTSPTPFYKSVVAWNASRVGYDLTFRDGTVYEFGHPNDARLIGIRDRFGNRLVIERNGITILRIVSPHGRALEFTTDASNRVTRVDDNAGRSVTYTYDGSGRLWKVTDVAGGVTEYTYDTSHRMVTIKDARGIVFLTNEYDGNGRVFRQTQPDTSTFQFAYTLDGNNRVTQGDVTDTRGFVRRVTFNSGGYALTDTLALGQPEQQTITYERQAGTNFVLATTDTLNRRTTLAYDADGHVTSVTRLADTAGAVTSTFTYEPTFGQVTSATDPLNHTTSLAYDSLGRLTRVTDPLNHQTTFTYTGAGQPLTVTDALNQTTQFGYDGGDLVSTTTPLGGVTTQFVDAAGRALNATDALGRRTTYDYNALNLLTRVTDSLGGQTTLAYDPNGNLLTLTDARNKTTTWTYDSMDRVATRTDPLSRQEAFTYDLTGNVTTWTDRKGQVTTYQYDSLDRQTFVGFGTIGTPPTYASSLTTTYDAGDRVAAVADSVAGTITPTYDLLDRLTGEVTPEGAVAYSYDAAGRRATMTIAGQPAISYSYDDGDRPTGITQGAATVGMAHDASNRRTSLTLPNGIVVEYGYDSDSRLTGLTYRLGLSTLGTLTYGYDVNGQRTSVGGTYARSGLPTALTSATYDDANQIATFGGTAFTYDANGNLTSDGAKSYTWNARNQLTGIAGALTASFAYDGGGRRRSRTVAGATTQFLYDGLNPVQELAGETPTANLLTGGLDEFFTRTDSIGARHFLTDALGSTAALADPAGTVQTSYTYEPFGGMATSGAATGNSLAFTGREADGTGLVYYRARYYDPRLQRFVAEDPLGFRGGDANSYAYVANSPGNWTDPLGLCPTCTGASAGVRVGGTVAGVPGAIIGGVIGGVGGYFLGNWIWETFFAAAMDFPDPLNPPSHWVPKGKDVWSDPTAQEWWHWHDDPSGAHGPPHWDIGGPRPPGGGKGPQDWWPKGGSRGPKPPGGQRLFLPPLEDDDPHPQGRPYSLAGRK